MKLLFPQISGFCRRLVAKPQAPALLGAVGLGLLKFKLLYHLVHQELDDVALLCPPQEIRRSSSERLALKGLDYFLQLPRLPDKMGTFREHQKLQPEINLFGLYTLAPKLLQRSGRLGPLVLKLKLENCATLTPTPTACIQLRKKSGMIRRTCEP